MKKIISLILALVLSLSLFTTAFALSRPVWTPESFSYTITQGETLELKYSIIHAFNNERMHVKVHKGDINGPVVAESDASFTSGKIQTDYTLTWDTAGVEPGKYVAETWMSFYTMYDWYEEPNRTSIRITVKGQPCKNGHKFDNGVSTKAATCTEAGAKTKTCTVCGSTETVSIAKTAHKWDGGTVNKEATAISAGSKTYKCKDCGETKTETIPAKFTDVDANKYYAAAVDWAYNSDVTSGLTDTTFGPDNGCTRGQVLTFLWRAMGSPEPATTVNPFKDVKSTDYYYKPILWGVEKGITGGTSATTFSPKDSCSYAHILTFIWRAQDQPGATGNGEWYSDALTWATENKLLDKTNAATNIKAACPRKDVVTYLYRILNK